MIILWFLTPDKGAVEFYKHFGQPWQPCPSVQILHTLDEWCRMCVKASKVRNGRVLGFSLRFRNHKTERSRWQSSALYHMGGGGLRPPRGRRRSPHQPNKLVAAGTSPWREKTELIAICRSQDCYKIWSQGSGITRPLRAGATTTPY